MITILRNLSAHITESIAQYQQRRADEKRQRNHINQIIEHMVDDIDPRLRSIRGYKKVLSPCVERILDYAVIVCARMPGPIEFSKDSYRANTTVRALFANHKKMAEVFSQCKAVQEFFRAHPSADHAYMILGMKKNESHVFGMEQHGDVIRKDVPQINVSFNDYRITHPSSDEQSLRTNLRERCMHECVAQTINQLIATQTYNDKLEQHEVKLKMQLSMLQNQQDGLGPLMQDDDDLLKRISHIKGRLQEVGNKNEEATQDMGTLNAFLDKAASLLKNPENLIDVSSLSLCVDRLNRLIESDAENNEDQITLAQVTFSGEEKRVGLLAVFPRKEFISPKRNKPVYSI